MRIVTRPDFDGVVCAVLLSEALSIVEPVYWVQPNEMQRGIVGIQSDDIIANLPFNENCALWFDHHYSNAIEQPFEGRFEIAPSAAGIIFRYYQDRLQRDYTRLVAAADKIDSADLVMDEILYPEKYPYILLSMTISGRSKADIRYCNRLMHLLRTRDIMNVIADPEVERRCEVAVRINKTYGDDLKHYTTIKGRVSITDFRSLTPAPDGNRFLVYSLFPETVVNLKIINDVDHMVIVKVGHSIVNRGCRVNVGKLLTRFEGGGHRGAGACRFQRDKAERYIRKILDVLLKNEPED